MSKPEAVDEGSAVTPTSDARPYLFRKLASSVGYLRAIRRATGSRADGTETPTSRGADELIVEESTDPEQTTRRCPYCGAEVPDVGEGSGGDNVRTRACSPCAAAMIRKENAWRSGKPLP